MCELIQASGLSAALIACPHCLCREQLKKTISAGIFDKWHMWRQPSRTKGRANCWGALVGQAVVGRALALPSMRTEVLLRSSPGSMSLLQHISELGC